MTTSRELRGAVYQRGTISLVLKVLIVVLLTSSRQGLANVLSKYNGIMLPNQPHQIVNVKNNITITCLYMHIKVNNTIEWILPTLSKFSTDEMNIRRNNRTSFTHFSNETHIASTLTITNARITDTGFYECHLQQFPDLKTEQYVYVWDKRHLVFNSRGVDRITVKHGQRAEIPCKPTHPDVRVTLKRNNLLAVETLSKEELDPDLLTAPNTKWEFDKQTGLTLNKATLSDYGSYYCYGSLGNTTYRTIFNIFIEDGIELTREGNDADDSLILEGSNVTLICRAHLISPPKWAYYLKDNDTHPIYIDETNPQLDGLTIVTENSTIRGEFQKMMFKSFLKLRNVSRNSPTTFQCMDGNINATRTSVKEAPILSFTVRVPQTPFIVDPDNSKIVLVKDQQSSLRCEGYGLPQPTFQWIKDGRPIDITGNDIIASGNLSSLNLHGRPGENGTYACRLNNSRHVTFKNFTVKFAEESQLSTIIIIVLAVVLIAAIGLSIKFYRDKIFLLKLLMRTRLLAAR